MLGKASGGLEWRSHGGRLCQSKITSCGFWNQIPERAGTKDLLRLVFRGWRGDTASEGPSGRSSDSCLVAMVLEQCWGKAMHEEKQDIWCNCCLFRPFSQLNQFPNCCWTITIASHPLRSLCLSSWRMHSCNYPPHKETETLHCSYWTTFTCFLFTVATVPQMSCTGCDEMKHLKAFCLLTNFVFFVFFCSNGCLCLTFSKKMNVYFLRC